MDEPTPQQPADRLEQLTSQIKQLQHSVTRLNLRLNQLDDSLRLLITAADLDAVRRRLSTR